MKQASLYLIRYIQNIHNITKNNNTQKLTTIPIGRIVEIANIDSLNEKKENNDSNDNEYAIVIGHEETKNTCDFEWNLHEYQKTLIQYLENACCLMILNVICGFFASLTFWLFRT